MPVGCDAQQTSSMHPCMADAAVVWFKLTPDEQTSATAKTMCVMNISMRAKIFKDFKK